MFFADGLASNDTGLSKGGVVPCCCCPEGDLQSGVSSALEGEAILEPGPNGVADLLTPGEEVYDERVIEEAFLDVEAPKESWLLMNMLVLNAGLGEAERTAS